MNDLLTAFKEEFGDVITFISDDWTRGQIKISDKWTKFLNHDQQTEVIIRAECFYRGYLKGKGL